MSWIFFATIAMLLWTVVNLLDKYIIGHELRDPYLVTTIAGLTIYLLFIIISVVSGSVTLPTNVALISLLAGLIYSIAMFFYYRSMKGMEVSRFVPLLATEPVLIAIATFVLFGERLNLANYFGIAFVAVGAALISWQKTDPKKKMTKYFVAMAVAVVLFATRNILIDQVTLKADFWPVMFWVGLGGVIVPLLLILFHHPHIRKQAEKGVWHLLFSGLLSGLALIAFTKAISIGSVTVVSAFLATKPLLVLVLATLLSFWHPKVIRERHSSSAMLIKVVATALIVSGAIFVLM